MRKDLHELGVIDEKVKTKLDCIRRNSDSMLDSFNEVKALKNDMFEKASRTFIYNLKKLIQLESTQKKLARKIGISEDLLSKYKNGEAFPSIETLIYICEVYEISMEKLILAPLAVEDIENLEDGQKGEYNLFEEKYYVYFFVTNINREGSIHEGLVEIHNDNAAFKILSNGDAIKCFSGYYDISDKLIFFNLTNPKDGTAYINMIRPNLNKSKYVGGLALMMLPSDANSKPCAQKILFSKIRIDRDVYYQNLKELLNFSSEGESLGHVKISQWEDEGAYNFIERLI